MSGKLRLRLLTAEEKYKADYDGTPGYLSVTYGGEMRSAVLEYETTSGEGSAEGPSSEWAVVNVETT